MIQDPIQTDFLVMGSGLAGLAFALKMADQGSVLILSKKRSNETNTNWAQGGIAAVSSEEDSFEKHVEDTLYAGGGLCKKETVLNVIEQAPDRIQDLIHWGVQFDLQEGQNTMDLTREGGHSKRRIYHVKDHTGSAIQSALLEKVKSHPNIKILENYFAIDLLIDKKINPEIISQPKCLGAYALNGDDKTVSKIISKATILATGGAGKTYLYTSNWEGATGDGIAMAYRAGCRVSNLEMMQFHPTCLYHPQARNFLITEALRGEGGELINSKNEKFMKRYHEMGSLAPRDVVAQAIDNEIKISGKECVYIDITHKSKEYLQDRFPIIYDKCAELGIFMEKDPIPVVPAAHYLCGGVLIDIHGRTDIQSLFAIGETSCSGLHGANRLASNSLLECLAFAHNSSEFIKKNMASFSQTDIPIRDWVDSNTENQDEMIVITHMWEEIRRLMWNYVGIVRSDKRLERAQHRLNNLLHEIKDYYWNFKMHTDILELRNLSLVASLTVQCALKRKESRGVHYNIDYPKTLKEPMDTIL